MFDPVDFHGLSKEIFSFVTLYKEALRRTQVSRCYYAAHLSAREKVRRFNPSALTNLDRLGEEHKVVRNLLKELGYPNISDKLYDLSFRRGKADYDLAKSVDDLEATRAMQESENILGLVQKARLHSQIR